MPRKPRNKPVAELIQRQSEAASQPPEAPQPFFHTSYRDPVAEALSGPPIREQAEAIVQRAADTAASERAAEPDTSFDTAAFDATAKAEPKRLACIADDRRNGVRIECENLRQPGQVYPRIFIRFADDKRPDADEKKMLLAEKFSYDIREKAWSAPKSATTTLLAKRCVNEITKMRDPDGLQLYI